jgi:hypothetical protein
LTAVNVRVGFARFSSRLRRLNAWSDLRFLCRVLLGAKTRTVHEQSVEQRRQLEQDAAERMARDDDPPDFVDV